MALDDPFFSIIIPTYNRGIQLAGNLKLILNQQFSSFEIIIVDDGGNDNTEELVNDLNSSKCYYFKTPNLERSHARNFGLRHAKGKYVNFFDSDDQMYNDRLQRISDFIQENDFPDVLFSHYDFVNTRGEVIGQAELFFDGFTKDILFNNFLATGSVFLKREIAQANPFLEDRRIITAEDWELWLRIHAAYEFTEFNQKTFSILQHEQRSLTTISASRIEERDSYFAQVVGTNPVFRKKYGTHAINLFISDRYTFIALTYVVQKIRLKAIVYLFRSLRSSLLVLKRKRFWASIKHLV